jgi:hypothetical protein
LACEFLIETVYVPGAQASFPEEEEDVGLKVIEGVAPVLPVKVEPSKTCPLVIFQSHAIVPDCGHGVVDLKNA